MDILCRGLAMPGIAYLAQSKGGEDYRCRRGKVALAGMSILWR